MDLLIQSKWVQDISELRKCLDTRLDSCTKCQGHSKNKPTCGSPISRASRSQITSVLLDIIKSGSLSSAAKHLEQLASLVLCKRWHQTQIAEKVDEWEAHLRSFLGIEQPNESKREAKTSSPETATCTSALNRRSVIRHETSQSTFNSGKVISSGSDVKGEDDDKTIPLEALPLDKRSTRQVNPEVEGSKVHEFTTYQRPKQAVKVNNSIVTKLITPFGGWEAATADRCDGYIYGYKLPEDHQQLGGESCQVIKIGYTNNPKRRMRQWRDQCKYEPQVSFMLKTPYYVKMEGIIHLQLQNERRKERCSVCSKQHQEFFEIDASRAEAVVRMWAMWAQLQPFDGEGRLSKPWSQKLADIDLNDPNCWEKFVFSKLKQRG